MKGEPTDLEGVDYCLVRCGMTIIELLIAMVLSSLLVVLALMMLGKVTDAWHESRSFRDTSSDGRATMLVVRRDFENRLRDVCVYVDPLSEKPDGLESNVLAFFLTVPGSPKTDADGHGDLSLVAYYLAYTPDLGGGSSQKLYRARLSPDEVREGVLRDGWDPEFFPDPTADEANGRADVVAINVLQFAVSGLIGMDDGSTSTVSGPVLKEGVRMVGVEVTLRILQPYAALRMESEEDWSGGTDAAEGLFDLDGDTSDDAGVRTFRTRLMIES